MVRVPKNIAVQLITFVKRIEIRANYWDPNATAAFEFARQMGSLKLKKFNPALHVEIFRSDSLDTPTIHVEYSDGTIWDAPAYPAKAIDLRNELYMRAEDCEDALEDIEGGQIKLKQKLLFKLYRC